MLLSAGLVLILLMLMHILSKRRGWSHFNVFRTVIVAVVGVGLCLVSLVATNRQVVARHLQTPWQIAAITISYLLVLTLTHLPHPPRIFIKKSDMQTKEDKEQETSSERPTLRRRRPSCGQNRLSQAAQRQSVAIRRGITTKSWPNHLYICCMAISLVTKMTEPNMLEMHTPVQLCTQEWLSSFNTKE